MNLPTFIEYLEIWQTLKVQTRYLFLTLLGPPFDGSTIPYSTLLSFCSSPGAKAARPLSGYPGLLPRWATLRFDEKLCRQKWCNIIAPKTIQNYRAPKTTESYGAKNYTNGFRCCDLTKKIWRQTNSQFFVHIHPVFPLNHLILKPVFLISRGKGCEAFIRISQPFTSLNDRRSRQEDTEEVELICSPATRRIYDGQGR